MSGKSFGEYFSERVREKYLFCKYILIPFLNVGFSNLVLLNWYFILYNFFYPLLTEKKKYNLKAEN